MAEETRDNTGDAPTAIRFDERLQDLVVTINHSDAEMPIVLTVHGLIVAGTLISYQKFVTETHRAMLDAARNMSAEQRAQEEAAREADLDARRPAIESPRPEVVTLKDAVIHTAMRPYDIGFWRVRLAAVDGYSVGITLRLPEVASLGAATPSEAGEDAPIP